MSLSSYKTKRDFRRTPEPSGDPAPKRRRRTASLRFCIQLHAATKRHYDFRLEIDGAMKSWAVPKGPSLDPLDRRLAVLVEDHPVEYCEFEGMIPAGNYGAGTVLLWDEGVCSARGLDAAAVDGEDELRRGFARGDLKFVLHGSKLNGEFALVRLKDGGGKNWLLLKKRDAHAKHVDVTKQDLSVRSGKSLAEIAASAEAEGRVWLPGRGQSKTAGRGSKAKPLPRGGDKKPKQLGRSDGTTRKPLERLGMTKRKQLGSGSKAPTLIGRRGQPSQSKTLTSRDDERRPPASSPLSAHYDLPLWQPIAALPTAKGVLLHAVYSGYRATLACSSAGVRLSAANGRDLTKRFPEIAAAATKAKLDAVLTGLIVPLDLADVPRPLGRAAPGTPGCYAFIVYDLLTLAGKDRQRVALTTRLKQLQNLKLPAKYFRLPERATLTRPLPPAVTGILARTGANAFLLARHSLEQQDHPPSPQYPETSPTRRPRMSGSQTAQSPRRQSTPTKAAAAASALPPATPTGSRYEVARLTSGRIPALPPPLTNLNKIYWPATGWRKGDLIAYYRDVAPLMLPHLRDRPQSLNRHPHGISGDSFFQKEMAGHVPAWIATATLISGQRGKSITYMLCQNLESLLYLANLGCIEINAWLSRVATLNSPDYVVIDLDPDQIAFTEVVRTAQAVRRVLEAVGATCYCKTSGSRGLHIFVPIEPVSSYDDTRLFAEAVCAAVHRQLPDVTSMERMPQRRRGRIYLDYLQNRIGQTMAAAYCVRPKPLATVSAPLRWSEVKASLSMESFTMQSMRRRLDRDGDLWPSIDGPKVALAACLERLKLWLKTAKS